MWCADWSSLWEAKQFPEIGNVVDGAGSTFGVTAVEHRVDASVSQVTNANAGNGGSGNAHGSSTTTDAETNLARRGSNFGLPIALHITILMKGSIGIAEVSECGRVRSYDRVWML